MDESHRNNDEIDIVELILNIYEKKNFIVISVLFSLSIAGALLYFTPGKYETTATVNAAPVWAFQEINTNLALIDEVDNDSSYEVNEEEGSRRNNQVFPEDALSLFERSINSRTIQEKAFLNMHKSQQAGGLADDSRSLGNLVLTQDNTLDYPALSLVYSTDYAQDADVYINDYLIPLSQNAVAEHFEKEHKLHVEILKNKLDQDIRILESNFEELNKLEIEALSELLIQARNAGVVESLKTAGGELSYLDGEVVIQSQIDLVKSRNLRYKKYLSNENSPLQPYVPGVADKVSRINELGKINADYSNLSLIVSSMPAIKPSSPVSPKAGQYIAISVFLGLCLGVVISLLSIAVDSRRM